MYANNSCMSTASFYKNEKIECRDVFSQQPQEIILKIFSYLSILQLIQCSEVSRTWNALSSDTALWNTFDLRTIFPSLKIFDESDWRTHFDLPSLGLEVKDAPPLNKRAMILALRRDLPSLRIEGDLGVTLLTIPKGLTFNMLVQLSNSAQESYKPEFRFWERISTQMGDSSVDKTYRIVITNNILQKSQNLCASCQKSLVKEIGCKIPKMLEATALLVVTFIRSKERLYNSFIKFGNPLREFSIWTYTRCYEKIDDYQLVVGGFNSNGFSISTYNHLIGGPLGANFDHVIESPAYSHLINGQYGVGAVLRNF